MYNTSDYPQYIHELHDRITKDLIIIFCTIIEVIHSDYLRHIIRIHGYPIILISGALNVWLIFSTDIHSTYHSVAKAMLLSVLPIIYPRSKIYTSLIITVSIYTMCRYVVSDQYIQALSDYQILENTPIHILLYMLIAALTGNKLYVGHTMNKWLQLYICMVFVGCLVYRMMFYMSINILTHTSYYQQARDVAVVDICNAIVDIFIALLYVNY